MASIAKAAQSGKVAQTRKARRKAKAKAAKAAAVAGVPRVQPRNTDVYLTWPFGPAAAAAGRGGRAIEQVACRCRDDRAHAVMVDGKIAPARTVAHARPRVYPRSMLNSAGLSIDSQADAAFEARCRAARAGFGDESEAAPGVSPISLETARRLERLEQQHGQAAVRRLTRTFGALRPEPGDLAAQAWLARHGRQKGEGR